MIHLPGALSLAKAKPTRELDSTCPKAEVTEMITELMKNCPTGRVVAKMSTKFCQWNSRGITDSCPLETVRSEERRVGKACRARGAHAPRKKRQNRQTKVETAA